MAQVTDTETTQPPSREPPPRHTGALVYAIAVYLLFLAVLGYGIGFFADVAVFDPSTIIDRGSRSSRITVSEVR